MFTRAALVYSHNGYKRLQDFRDPAAGPVAAFKSDGRLLKQGRRISLRG